MASQENGPTLFEVGRVRGRVQAGRGAISWPGAFMLVALALSSVYVLPSGLPQPSDVFWLLFCLAVLAHAMLARGTVAFPSFMRWWLPLLVIVSIVNGVWAAKTVDVRFLIPIAYWTYNFLIGWCVLIFLRSQGDSAVLWLRWAIVTGLVISGVGVLLDLGSSSRTSGWFNNPNQLAYHSICLISLLLLVEGGRLRLKFSALVAFGAGVVSLLAASSLAGFGALALIVFAILAASGVSLARLARIGAVFGLVLAVVGMVGAFMGGALYDNINTRIDRMGSKVEDVEDERKFYRISEHPQMLVLGAGEGGLYRFGPNEAGEMHSSFGTLLFSYGVTGIFLFVMLLGSIVKAGRFWVSVLLCAPLVYSLTHMGLRFTVFWVFLVVAFELGGRHVRRGSSNGNPVRI